MAKQLSSLDTHFLLKELEGIKDSRVDKIYNMGKEELYIQLHKSNKGKNILKLITGKAVFITDEKFSDEKPSHFCAMLRKHLEGKFLVSLTQIKPERILELKFKSKDDQKTLYVEIFGKGNAILCDKDNIIVEALTKHKFRDRSILPKQKYQHPVMLHNFFDLDEEKLSELFKNSTRDKLVTLLATELGLGGIYSEEICLSSEIDKNKEPKKISNKETETILKSIKKLVNKKSNPKIIYEDKAVDVIPISLDVYDKKEENKFRSFNEALDYYFKNEVELISRKESKYEKQIDELKRIIEEQETTLISLKTKEIDNREKAEIVYNNYKLINEVLEEISKAKEKHSWEEIKKRLKGHKIIKDIDVKEKRITLEL